MPFLTFEARGTCPLCGCRLRGFHMGTYRVNKSSFVTSGKSGGIGWLECPECGPSHARRNPLGVRPTCSRYALDGKSQELVDEVRARKGWS